MTGWRYVRALWRNLRHRGERERELAEELEAYYAAAHETSGEEQVKEAVREARAGAWIESVARDVSYAARRLRQHAWYATAVIMVLGVGIGLTTALFAAVNGLILQPLPFPEPQRLADISAVPSYWVVRTRDQKLRPPLETIFSDVAVYREKTVSLTGVGAPPVRMKIAAVTRDFFPMFGGHLLLGQNFSLATYQQPAATIAAFVHRPPTPVVLSEGLWRERYGARRDILGRTLNWGGVEYQVVGIMPQGFAFPSYAQAWMPYLGLGGRMDTQLDDPLDFTTVVRLRPGLAWAEAERQLAAWVRKADQSIGGEPGSPPYMKPLQATLVGERRGLGLLLWAASGMVLLLATAGALGLGMAQAWGRRREMALRLAIGAGPRRLRRQLITEGGLLGLGAGAAGWGVAEAAGAGLAHLWSGTAVAMATGPGAWAAAVALGVALACGVALGLVGRSAHWRADAALYGRGGGERQGLHGAWLAAVQLGLAAILLAATAALGQSWFRLARVPTGMNPRGVLAFEASVPEQDRFLNMFPQVFARQFGKDPGRAPAGARALAAEGEAAMARIAAFQRALPGTLDALPGVQSAGLVGYLPFEQNLLRLGLVKPGIKRPRSPADMVITTVLNAGPGALGTLGIPLLRGRDFTASDGAGCEAVASEDLMRAFHLTTLPAKLHRCTVIGVAGGVRQGGPRDAVRPTMYDRFSPYDASPFVVVRARPGVAPLSLMPEIRRAVAKLAPEAALSHITTAEAQLAATHTQLNEATRLFGLFAALAALIAAVSVFAAAALETVARTREVGVRMALGARPGDIRRLMLGRQTWTALAALTAAFPLSWLLERGLGRWLFAVQPGDGSSFAAAAVLLGILVLAAAWWPARRAVRVSPLEALRHE